MNTQNLRWAAMAVVLGMALAPAAQAQAPSRGSGVGKVIAEQGNAALKAIKAELSEQLKAWRPQIDAARPEAVPASQPRRTAAGSGDGVADTVHAAP